jgi:hypothetical protein
MTNPLDAALSELRQAVREAEERMTELQTGGRLNDAMRAAGDVYVARKRVREAEQALDKNANTRRGADALARAMGLNPDTDPQED